jgi:hypothetical protein
MPEVKGRGRPAVGPVIEVRLPDSVLAALEAEAVECSMKRAELVRWIVAERYGIEPGI